MNNDNSETDNISESAMFQFSDYHPHPHHQYRYHQFDYPAHQVNFLIVLKYTF